MPVWVGVYADMDLGKIHERLVLVRKGNWEMKKYIVVANQRCNKEEFETDCLDEAKNIALEYRSFGYWVSLYETNKILEFPMNQGNGR